MALGEPQPVRRGRGRAAGPVPPSCIHSPGWPAPAAVAMATARGRRTLRTERRPIQRTLTLRFAHSRTQIRKHKTLTQPRPPPPNATPTAALASARQPRPSAGLQSVAACPQQQAQQQQARLQQPFGAARSQQLAALQAPAAHYPEELRQEGDLIVQVSRSQKGALCAANYVPLSC